MYPDDAFVRVVGNANALNLSVLLRTWQGNRSVEAQALLDSGATSNFINYRLINKYKIKTVPLKSEMIVRNADETENILGRVKEKAYLAMKIGNHREVIRFFFDHSSLPFVRHRSIIPGFLLGAVGGVMPFFSASETPSLLEALFSFCWGEFSRGDPVLSLVDVHSIWVF